MPPRHIGQYQILNVLGTGGIGCVYRALDSRTGEQVALKLLSTGPALDPVAARRMAREFETLYDLSHPNVVRVFDTGVFRGYPYLTMELIEGLTLREYLALDEREAMASREHDPLSPEHPSSDDPTQDDDGPPEIGVFGLDQLAEEANSEEAGGCGEVHASGHGPDALRRLADEIDEPMTAEEDCGVLLTHEMREAAQPDGDHARLDPNLTELARPERIALLKDALLQICEALAYVHARGMVHRDLKPSNIMVDDDRRVKLMDFGLAKFVAEDTSVTAVGRIVGTYRYMAPEQLLGERVDGRTDLYSLGVMLYELLSGRPPFDAKSPLEMCQKVLENDPVPLMSLVPDVDEQLARVAHRLMHKDPDERYQTAEEVFEVLTE